MNTVSLGQALLDSELRHINFFNGRLLSADDLSAEQEVQHAHGRLLGQANGSGVAWGLEVTPAPSSPEGNTLIAVKAGLAVNPAGQTLRLECDQTLSLVEPVEPGTADECVFSDCAQSLVGVIPSGAGYYLLTVAPASRPEGRAPVSGLGNAPAACNSRYFAEGVQFRLLRLAVTPGTVAAQARNLVAYQCFGLVPGTAADFLGHALEGVDPIDDIATYGLDQPTAREKATRTALASRLTPQDVPLAVIEWQGAAALGFVDQWSVRRRMATPNASGLWAAFAADRRIAEGEAMLLQFQEHLASLPGQGVSLTTLQADTRFAYLPAAGVLPGGAAGADWRTFLGPLAPPAETAIDVEIVANLLRGSFANGPIPVPVFASAANASNAAPWAGPLNVYRVPGRDEVIFAASSLGRVRVFLNVGVEASAGGIALQLDGSNVVLRSATSAPNRLHLIDAVPAGTHRLQAAPAGFNPLPARDVAVVAGRITDVTIALTPATPTAPSEGIDTPDLCVTVATGSASTVFDRLSTTPMAIRICVISPVPAMFPELPFFEDRSLVKNRVVAEWLLAWRKWIEQTLETSRTDTPAIYYDAAALKKALMKQSKAKVIPKPGLEQPQKGNPIGYAVFGKLALPLSFARVAPPK